MQNESENKPSRKRPRVIAFFFAGLSLFLLDGAADSLLLHKINTLGWMLVAAGLALIGLAVLWGIGRV